MAHVNRLVGKCVNIELGRSESLWSPEPYSAVELETEADVIDKILYVLGNPVQGALVESWRQWPGAISGPRVCSQASVTVQRPSVYFRSDGDMPESVRLGATVPPDFSHLSAHQFATKIAKLLDVHEAQELEKHAAQGRELLGREAWLAFKSGVKEVVFPAGTYWMVRHAGCVAASPG